MFDLVYEDIYGGDIETMTRQAAVRRDGISAGGRLDQIERQEGQWSDAFTLLDMPISDGEYLNGDIIDPMTAFINERVDAGDKILVHCQLGISRSVSLVMAYLIAYEGMSLAKAFGTLRARHVTGYINDF